MAGFLSTLRNGCKALFTSFTSTLTKFKKWFRREIAPTLEEIVSTIHRLYFIHIQPLALRILRFTHDHPIAIAISIMSIIAVVWPSIIVGPILFLLGFKPVGPAAGSIAAFAQSMLGNVIAGSAFATLQSAGMAGFRLAILCTSARIIAGLVLMVTLRYLVREWQREEKKHKTM